MIYYESRAEIGSGIEYGSPQRKPFIKGNNKTNSGGAIPVFQALGTAVYRTVKQFIDLD